MTAEHRDSAERAFIDMQHRYRGLIANLRSRRFVKDRRVPPSRQFRGGLSEWFLDARAALSPEQYRPLLEWMRDLAATQLGELSQAPIQYEELAGIYSRAPVVPLEHELLWIAERVRLEIRRLSVVVAAMGPIEAAIFAGKYDDALEAIEMLQNVLGVSLWSVQLRLAVEHLAGGLEGQKRYSAEVRKVYRHGLLGFTTYHTSVRNEDRTTLAKFVDDVEARIENHAYYDEPLKAYSRYRLKNDLPTTESELADILRVEQSHGIVDIYQTYVAILQELARRDPSQERAAHIVHCIRVSGMEDFRLTKIVRLLDPDAAPPLSPRDSTLPDALFAGRSFRAARAAHAARRRYSADVWRHIYAGFALSQSAVSHEPAVKPDNIVDLIARVQSRCDGSDDAWTQVAKLALNLRGLPLGAGLLEFLVQLRRATPDQPWRPWLIGLNSPCEGPEDRPWSLGCASTVELRGQAAATWYEASCPDTLASQPAMLARAAGHIHRGDFALAIEALGDTDTGWPESLRTLRALMLLHAFHARGERQKVIALIANEGARSPIHAQFLPVSGALRNYQWPDFKAVAHPLAAPIALHLLWTAEEASLVGSQMRFATGAALRNAAVARPSELIDRDLDVAPHELIYFLRDVCVPDILDLSRLFSGTRQIMEERQAICSALSHVDPDNADTYADEIALIANALLLDDGRWIVDSTRIHVDSDALIRWAVRELAEDYERYRDLVQVDVAAPQSFEDVLRELKSHPSQQSNFTPDNEADAVLVSILRRLGDEFLTNASFGLDFYLSKRIRHQSFIGLIRGPLEFAGLITTRESEAGEYHRNEQWIGSFTWLSTDERDRIDQALRTFATKFDETLTEAKDTHFHLRTVDKPLGMIFLSLNDRLIGLARAIIRMDFSFREFLGVAVPVLWTAIEPSLAAIRTLISGDIKAKLIHEFDIVRATVREVAESDPAFLEFDAAMGRGSAEVQVKLDEAANWFVHADTLRQHQLFTLEQMLQIGVDTALKSQRGYSPKITHVAEGELQLHAPNLVFVHDALFVALGNAHKHSGLKSPQIDVRAIWDEPGATLTLEIISDCRQSNRSEKENQANAIRKAIADGAHAPRTRTEGGSGFAKLAAVVNQSERGRIDFGFTPQGRFRLEVTYAVLLPAQELADAA